MEKTNDQITRVTIENEMRSSYLDYAMSVIIGRALPDVRDGLKPVHRRVLYAMFREGLLHNRKYSKCAGVVGEVLKKYHPHGDAAVYDTLVRLAQDWNMRYPLVDGQGNFGSIDGDSAAAYRYTESRMTHLAEMMLQDIDKNTVDFADNFDGSTTEPQVLPTRFPTLLVNGSDGIAVGMATKIPPHNLSEVIQACVALIDDPSLTSRQIVKEKKLLRGPDFPTGGIMYGLEDILHAYETGRGVLQLRAKTHVEEDEDSGRQKIIVTELPYQVNKARLVEKIADLVREKKLDGLSDLRDESNREGIRVVIELKMDAIPEVVLNHLFKHTPLQTSFGINLLAIVKGKPEILTLKDFLVHFLEHRKDVTRRRCAFELEKAKDRQHLLEGLSRALERVDDIIQTIRATQSTADAKEALVQGYGFSERQAQAILDLRLQKLTSLEQSNLQDERKELSQSIVRLQRLLDPSDLGPLMQLIRQELLEIQEKFGDARKTVIYESRVDSISLEDLIPEEEMVVTLTRSGYIKRTPLTEYRAQHRGGRGVQAMSTKEEDFVVQLFAASTHHYVLVFTNQGRLYHLKVHEIPKASRTGTGKPLVNLISFEGGEEPKAVLPLKDFSEGRHLFFATKQGVVKKTELMAFSRVRSTGLIAIRLDDGDELIGVDITDGSNEIVLGSLQGQAARFKEQDVRATNRDTRGVSGIRLEDDDEVVSLVVTHSEGEILTVTENGFGKCTLVDDYRRIKRAGKGVITIKASERNGKVAALLEVRKTDQLMFTTDTGRAIRINASEIRSQGRNTQGVRLFRIDPGERITSVARVAESDPEAPASSEAEDLSLTPSFETES